MYSSDALISLIYLGALQSKHNENVISCQYPFILRTFPLMLQCQCSATFQKQVKWIQKMSSYYSYHIKSLFDICKISVRLKRESVNYSIAESMPLWEEYFCNLRCVSVHVSEEISTGSQTLATFLKSAVKSDWNHPRSYYKSALQMNKMERHSQKCQYVFC